MLTVLQSEAVVDEASFCPRLSVAVFRTLAEMAAATSIHVVAIIEPIIQHADWFFPDGKDIYMCCIRSFSLS